MNSQALNDLDSLREIPLVRYLHHVSPHALVVLGEDGRDVLDGAGAGSHGGVQAVEGGGGEGGVAVAANAVGGLEKVN